MYYATYWDCIGNFQETYSHIELNVMYDEQKHESDYTCVH
jgi:hypothetical protein